MRSPGLLVAAGLMLSLCCGLSAQAAGASTESGEGNELEDLAHLPAFDAGRRD
jgi:hypothetical protein